MGEENEKKDVEQTITIASDQKQENIQNDTLQSDNQEQHKKHKENKFFGSIKVNQLPLLKSLIMPLLTSLSNLTSEIGITLSLTTIQNELNMEYNQVQWISSVYYLAICSLAIPSSKLCQKYGVILVHIICLALMIPERILCFFFYDNYIVTVILRLLDGAFTTGTIASRNSCMVLYTQPKDKQKSLQINVIIGWVFMTIFPLCYGYLITWDFRYQYIISAIASVLGIISLLPYKNIILNKQKLRFDYLGTIAITLFTLSLCLIFTFITYQQWIVMAILIVVCVLSAVGFIFAEKKVQDPLIPLFIMKNPVSTLFILNTCKYMAFTALQWIVQYLLNDATLNGYYSSGLFLTSTIASILIPIINRRVVIKLSMSVAYIIEGIILLVMVFFVDQKTVYAWLYVISGLFLEFVGSTVFTRLMLSVPQHLSTYVSTLPTTSRTIANSIALCFVSCVTQTLDPDFETAQIINTSVLLVLDVLQIFLMWFVLGCDKTEKGLIGYKEKDVKELKIDERYKQHEEQLVDQKA